MARRTLYPTTPGETAVDRLLNQTLPNIIKEERARSEREELRQEEKARYEAEFKYRVARDTKTDLDNFTSDFNNYYMATMRDKEDKNYDGGSIHILEKHVGGSKFATESQLDMVKTLKADLQNGKGFSDTIDLNTTTLNSTTATKTQKFNAYVKNLELLSLYGTQTQKSDFENSIENAGDPSLAFINANRNHLGVITGMDSKINEAFVLSDKIDSGMDFDMMDSDSKEAFLPYLSVADQERFKSPFGDTPNYQSERNSALRAAYLRSGQGIFNQEGKTFLESTISTYGGVDNFDFSMKQLREQEPIIYKNFMEKFAKAGDFATRGTAERIEAEAEGPKAVEEYITQYLEEKGYKRSLFDAPPKRKDPNENIAKPFKDEFEGLSSREVIKVITDGKFTEPIFSRAESYFLQEIDSFKALQAKKIDPNTTLTASEENEFNRIRTLISKYPEQYKLLTNERYLKRRGAGKYVVRQTGLDTDTYPYSNEVIKRTSPVVKTGIKLVKGIEDAEAGIIALRNTLETALIEGDRYVVTDPVALDALRLVGIKKGKGNVIKRFEKNKILAAIKVLEGNIVAADKKLNPIVNSLKAKFDLFKDYDLVEIVNQGEDLSARDISYFIRKKNS